MTVIYHNWHSFKVEKLLVGKLMDKLKVYIIERLKEKQTYIGLSAFFASVQYKYTDALVDDVAALFILLCGLIMVFTKD